MSALESSATLRYWQLVSVMPGTALLYSPLTVSARLLEFTLGYSGQAEGAWLANPSLTASLAIDSHERLLKPIEQQWLNASQPPLSVLNLVSARRVKIKSA